MKRKTMINILTIMAIIVLLIGIYMPVLADTSHNTFVMTFLRTDLPELKNAQDYIVKITAIAQPTGGFPDYVDGWLGIDLDNQSCSQVPFCRMFSQVGILADSTGLYWFVYAEPGVTCLEGESAWGGLGCKERRPSNYIHMNTSSTVELVKYSQNDYWIARVSDYTGTSHDVARILSNHLIEYNTEVAMEEAFGVQSDPYLLAGFFFEHPQYNAWTQQGWRFLEWPDSNSAASSTLKVGDVNLQNSDVICPQHYAAILNLGHDPRFWFAGSSGNICQWTMFNFFFQNIPIVKK